MDGVTTEGAIERELKVLRSMAGCRGDDQAIDEAESELAALRAEVEALQSHVEALQKALDENWVCHRQIIAARAKVEALRVDAEARIAAAVAADRERMRAAIADDAYAATFQSLGQYRSALLRSVAPKP